jgi:PAS domain-containing protein
MLPDGAVKYLESVGQTERKRTQEALRESEYELRQIIETVPSHLWSTSPDLNGPV